MLTPELRQRTRHEGGSGGGESGKPEVTGLACSQSLQCHLGLEKLIRNGSSSFGEQQPSVGGTDPSTRFFEQRRLRLALKDSQALADGRRAVTQGSCGRGDRALLDDGSQNL
jgi:hypothetical protein